MTNTTNSPAPFAPGTLVVWTERDYASGWTFERGPAAVVSCKSVEGVDPRSGWGDGTYSWDVAVEGHAWPIPADDVRPA